MTDNEIECVYVTMKAYYDECMNKIFSIKRQFTPLLKILYYLKINLGLIVVFFFFFKQVWNNVYFILSLCIFNLK